MGREPRGNRIDTENPILDKSPSNSSTIAGEIYYSIVHSRIQLLSNRTYSFVCDMPGDFRKNHTVI